MAKSPDKRKARKDPARPTRSKAARPDEPATPEGLADLLNPGINKGTAGLGSGTGLKPPPDNSWDRRRDFSEAHRARKSTREGFGEAPQRDYAASPITGLDPALASELGIGDDADSHPSPDFSSSPPPLRGRSPAEAESEGGREGGDQSREESAPTLPSPASGGGKEEVRGER